MADATVITAESDDGVDCRNSGPLHRQPARHDLVIAVQPGSAGCIGPGAMPPMHRYLGIPYCTGLGRFLSGPQGVGDSPLACHPGLLPGTGCSPSDCGIARLEFALRTPLCAPRLPDTPSPTYPHAAEGHAEPQPHLSHWRNRAGGNLRLMPVWCGRLVATRLHSPVSPRHHWLRS